MMFPAWQERRDRKRAASEARQLANEARRILKKKNYRIPESVAHEIEGAIAAVDLALKSEEVEKIRQALSKLDEKMDEHLAFARKSTIREYAESIGVAVAIALLLRAFVVEAFQIPSGSMIPTLEVGDHIFVSKFAYGIGIPFTNTKLLQLGPPKRGDIIVFKYPADPEIDYIKRVVGLPGERVEVRKNEIFIDGRPMPRRHVPGPCREQDRPLIEGTGTPCELWMEELDGKTHQAIHQPAAGKSDHLGTLVPAGHVFVMGDNRDNSNDSRVWGTVPLELIKGRALIVWWSRGPTAASFFTPAGVKEWFSAIRWRRFFTVVE